MLSNILSSFYARDLRKLIDEINSFKQEENIWRTQGEVKNSAGNLALHVIGGSNYFFGTVLSASGYVRGRDNEFTQKGIARNVLVSELEKTIPIVTSSINALSEDQLDNSFPIRFDGADNSTTYVIVQLLTHLNYHLGQVNYLRRTLEPFTAD
jgi:Protein of unknown function (DUF1572)